MPDNDLMVLGFGFENKEAITGITQLTQNLNSLDSVHNRIKSNFEEGFGLGNNSSGSITAFSDLIKTISAHGKSISDLASGFKNISAVIPKLSGEKINPVSDDVVKKMEEFSLAGTAAGSSLASLVDGSFVARMREGRKELGAFNSALLHISQNARDTKTHLTGIPGMLNKLKADQIKPVSKDTLKKLGQLAASGEKASAAMVSVVPTDLPLLLESTGKQFFFLASNLKVASENAKEAKTAFDGIKTVLPKISAKTIQPVTEATIQSMREYAQAVNSAADEIGRIRTSTTGINRSKSSLADFSGETVKTITRSKSLGSELLNIATMTSLPMFFRNAAREAVNFGAELAQIESLTLNFSAEKLRSGLLAMPSAFGEARKNANALYYAYSSGVEGTEKELVDFTAQISKLAQVIRANQTDTVNAVTSAFNAYNLSVRDAAEVSDLFYAIVKRGKAEGNQLATGLGQVIPTAATAGLTLNEMGASITSLTKVMQTRNAITYFNNMISKLIKPTKESRLEAKKLGIELGLDALRAKGFSQMMEELRQKTLGNQEALLKIFPDLRGQRAALQLLNKGWGDFQSQLDFFNKKAGITDAAFEKLNESIEYQLSILPQTFGKIRIAAGEVMISILTLGGALEPVLRAFNNMGVTGQRVVGALTLMGAAYGLLKAKTFLFNTVQGVEIRHQQVLSALRTKEVAERSSITAAVTAETAAKAKLSKAQKLQMLLERRNEKARLASFAVDDQRAKYEPLSYPSVGPIVQQKALLNLRKAEAEFLKQENKAMLLQNRILKENIALKTTSAKAGVASKGVGTLFAGGFSSGAADGLAALASAWTGRGSAAKRQLILFKRGIASFGKTVGSIFGFVVKLFTPLNLMITGGIAAAVGLLDVLSSKTKDLSPNAGLWETWENKIGNSRVVRRVGEWLVDFFTGAITEAERLSKILDDKKDAKLLAQSMSELGKQLILPYTVAADNAESFATQIQILEQNRKKAFANLRSESMSKNIREYNDIQKQLNDFGDMGAFSWQKTLAKINKEYKTSIIRLSENDFRRSDGGYTLSENDIKAIKAIKKEKELFDQKTAQYSELQKKAQELSDKIRPAIETARRAGESEISFYSRQRAMFESIVPMIEAQRFSMMKPAEQMKKQQEYIKDYEKALAVAAASGNGENASRAVKNILDTYKDMLKNIDTSLKELGRFGENLAVDGVDFLIKAATSTADKVKIFTNRAQKLFSQSKVKVTDTGLAYDYNLSNAELEKSYGKLKSAVSMQINAVQSEIDSKRKLADAEKRANENTLKLIQSFDKFKSTAVDAVDAFSVDAIKLQSRTFDTLPAFAPQSSAQSGLQAQQQKLNDLYTKMADIAQKFADVVNMRTALTQSQQTNLTAQLEAFMQKQEQAAEKSRQEQIKKMNEVLTIGKEISGKFAALTESSRQTANNTRTTANNMNVMAFN